MANVGLFNDSPTSGGVNGTLVSASNPIEDGPLLADGAAVLGEPVKLAVRVLNSGYYRPGSTTLTLVGATATAWALAPDNAGAPGTWEDWGDPLSIAGPLENENVVFWIRPRSLASEDVTTTTEDVGVLLQVEDDVLYISGRSLALPYGVNTAVGRSLALPSVVLNSVARSVALPYEVQSDDVGRSLALPYTVIGEVGRSLALPYTVVGEVGRSLALPYTVDAWAAGITHYTVGAGPIGLCEDQHGNVWVAALTASQLQRITPDGTVTTFSMADAADDPRAIVSDGTNLYVTHATGMTKVSGDLTGTPTIARTTAMGATYGVAIGSDGYLYATDSSTKIKKIDPATMAVVTAWGTSGEKETAGATFRYITAGDSGFLYACDRANNRVYKIAVANATANANIGTGPDASADFSDIVYNGTDLYLVGQGTGKIYRVTLAGTYTGTVIGASTSLVTGIAIGADGRVYTAGWDASYANIYSIAAGATPGTPTNHGALTAAANWDVLGHSNGTIWVAEYGSAKVARLVL